jgi:hypothetical protein
VKNIVIASILSFGLVGCAISPPVQSEPAKFEKIYEIQGLAKDQIYDGVRQWFAIAYKSADAVIQYEDKSAGTIIGKGNMAFPCTGALNCMANQNVLLTFTTRVDSKDGKMRVTYDDLMKKSNPSYSNGIRLNGYEIPIAKNSYDAEMVQSKLNLLSDEMASKIQKQQKVNSDW